MSQRQRTIVFTKKDRTLMLKDLQFIFDNAHKSRDPKQFKFGAGETVHMYSANLRCELADLKRIPHRKEISSFPGLVLAISILKTMNTRENAMVGGYLIWPNPAKPQSEGTPLAEADYSDHTRRGTGSGYTVYLNIAADFLRKEKDATRAESHINLELDDKGREVFVCPFPKWGDTRWTVNRCGNKTARLFLPAGSKDFGCAKCYGIKDDAPTFWRQIEYFQRWNRTRAAEQASLRKRDSEHQKETARARAARTSV